MIKKKKKKLQKRGWAFILRVVPSSIHRAGGTEGADDSPPLDPWSHDPLLYSHQLGSADGAVLADVGVPEGTLVVRADGGILWDQLVDSVQDLCDLLCQLNLAEQRDQVGQRAVEVAGKCQGVLELGGRREGTEVEEVGVLVWGQCE